MHKYNIFISRQTLLTIGLIVSRSGTTSVTFQSKCDWRVTTILNLHIVCTCTNKIITPNPRQKVQTARTLTKTFLLIPIRTAILNLDYFCIPDFTQQDKKLQNKFNILFAFCILNIRQFQDNKIVTYVFENF